MNKKKLSKFNNQYEVADAFRFFFFLIITVFLVSFVYNIVLNIIASIKGITFEALYNSDLVQVITNCLSPVTFIIFFLVYNSVRKIKYTDAFGDGQKISLLPISVAIVLAIIAIFLFTPFMNLIDYFFETCGYAPDDTIPLTDKMQSSGAFFLLGLVIYALLPAIAEELVFRGVIQKSLLSRFNGFVAIFFSSLLFVLMHGSLQQTFYQLVMAILLGYLACVGGSILYSIILHFLNNALVLVFSCFDIIGYLNPDNTIYYNAFSMIFPICIFLLGVVLVGILFWVLKYLRNKNFFRESSNENPPSKTKVLEPKIKVELTETKKFGLKDMWKNMTQLERIFMLASLILIGSVWIVNTINGFIS
ncbi:MAG: lysostaphin resistance A-like protein [Christensenellales bacterium]